MISAGPEHTAYTAALKKIGLIVNPIAGMGGKVGLKGTDGRHILEKAIALGAKPESPSRAATALENLAVLKCRPLIVTGPGKMGEDTARSCGFVPVVLGVPSLSDTTAEDTEDLARKILNHGVDLLLFSGGDGTARNIVNAVGGNLPVLGIPAGVKIHSAVFGTSPGKAGALARLYIEGKNHGLAEGEVMDIDEEAVRAQCVKARLYGYLNVPFERRLRQNLKAGQSGSEIQSLNAVGAHIARSMEEDCIYILGPGTTIKAVMTALNLPNTLIGVDAVKNGALLGNDLNESQLLELIHRQKARIIVTVIGGQGYLFGRGNQQISHRVIRAVGRNNITVISPMAKLISLEEKRLLVDTGDAETDDMLQGHMKVIIGPKKSLTMKVSAG